MIPHGIIPAMVTPLTKEQRLDEAGLRLLVNHLIEQGAHGLFCLGTNGEFFSLQAEEKIRVAQIVVEETAGRVPVYAGSGGNSTQETIQLTQQLELLGVNAVSVITPYFLTYSQKELEQHYQAIAAATSLPVLLYNIPNPTGNHLQPTTVAKLAEVPNIVGIKDSSGKMDIILQYIDCTDDTFAVLAGTDSLILSTLMSGGKGAIAATANLVPSIVSSIYEHWKSGNIEEAARAQNMLRPIRQSFALGTLPSVLKAAMNLQGLPGGMPRSPVQSLGEKELRKLQEMIQFYIDQGVLSKVI